MASTPHPQLSPHALPKRTRSGGGLPKPATVGELIAVVEAFNKAHELVLRDGVREGLKDPFFEELYSAATNAAKSLGPLCKVRLVTVSKTAVTSNPLR